MQAAFLATLLVSGRYPCLPVGQADFVRFQSKQLGYQTDDIFVKLVSNEGATHRLLIQAKSNMTFTEGSADFRKTLEGAWTDFKNFTLFDPEKDFILLATGPGSKKEIEHFRPILNWSRSAT